MFGEENHCPHCLAYAAVRPSAGGYVCMACSQPREVFPGTVIEQAGSALPLPVAGGASLAPKVQSFAAHGGALGLRIFGGATIAGATLTAALTAVFVGGAAGFVIASVVGGLGLAIGGLSIVVGNRIGRRATQLSSASRELDILAVAERLGGEVYATDVARALSMSSAEADAALSALVDGTRVVADLTPEGLVKYVFREVRPRPAPPRVRVGDVVEPPVEEAEVLRDREEREREEDPKR